MQTGNGPGALGGGGGEEEGETLKGMRENRRHQLSGERGRDADCWEDENKES